ncbi:Transmembrane 9 superfamily member 4 [Lamellibrachia satsuma]|nr:Transmembrane 9 superfamily member 4 [Lamellibrachia satsuma]
MIYYRYISEQRGNCSCHKYEMARNVILSVLLCLASADLLCAFYLPGVAPKDFKPHDLVEVKAIKLTSVKAQLPYNYYSLPFCEPHNGIVYKTENLGEVLRGDRIVNTPYQVRMTEPVKCAFLCNKTLTEEQSKLVAKRIQQQYNVHLLTDNLPCATKISMSDSKEATLYEHGYKLGFVSNKKVFLFNHLKLKMKFHHREEEDIYRVVGFEVEASSIKYDTSKEPKKGECPADSKEGKQSVEIAEKGTTDVMFTYEVTWEKSDVQWTSRWDTYLDMSDVQIHWFSIINSVVVVFFLAGESLDRFFLGGESLDRFFLAGESLDRFFLAGESLDHFFLAGESLDRFFLAGESRDRFFLAGESLDRFFLAGESRDRFFLAGESLDRFFLAGESRDRFFLAGESLDRFFLGGESLDRFFLAGESLDRFFLGGESLDRFFLAGESLDRFFLGGESLDRFFLAGESLDRFFLAGESLDRFFLSGESLDRFFLAGESLDRFFLAGESLDRFFLAGESLDRFFLAGESLDRFFLGGESLDRFFLAGESLDRFFLAGESLDRFFLAGESLDRFFLAGESLDRFFLAGESRDRFLLAGESLDRFFLAGESLDNFFLAGILAMIIVRTLNRDIARYNRIDDEEDTFEETGWKLVHGDVFRPPKHTKMLASLVGSGTQLLCSSFFVIAFAMLGMLSPAARGSLMTAALFIFVFFGMVAGYYAGRLYRTMKGMQWKKAAFQTAMFYPAVMFGVCFVLNFFIWGKHSSGAGHVTLVTSGHM